MRKNDGKGLSKSLNRVWSVVMALFTWNCQGKMSEKVVLKEGWETGKERFQDKKKVSELGVGNVKRKISEKFIRGGKFEVKDFRGKVN